MTITKKSLRIQKNSGHIKMLKNIKYNIMPAFQGNAMREAGQ